MRVLRCAAVGVALLTGASGTLSEGQFTPQAPPISTRGNQGMPSIDGRKPGDPDAVSPVIVEQQARTRNSDRQKKMVEDTNKLVSLATDLKQQVESKKDDTSGDASKKAEEIEKLARSVRDRMKG